METVLVIKAKEGQAILDYLTSRPYKETYQLVGILVNAPSEDRGEAKQEAPSNPPDETI